MDMQDSSEALNIVIVIETVVDITLPHNKALAESMKPFVLWLDKHQFTHSNKIPLTLEPRSIEAGGVVVADAYDGCLDSENFGIHPILRLRFPVGLREDYNGPMDAETVFRATPGASVGIGSNSFNMLYNLLRLITALPSIVSKVLHITVLATSDPFRDLPTDQADSFRRRCEIIYLDSIPDRLGIHIPCDNEMLIIGSPPKLKPATLAELPRERSEIAQTIQKADLIVSSVPAYEAWSAYTKPNCQYFVIPSQAFLFQTAIESHGCNMVIPLVNSTEAIRLCEIYRQRESGLNDNESPAFPPPLTSDGNSIDWAALHTLSRWRNFQIKCNPPRYTDLPSFTHSVSLGQQGGVIRVIKGQYSFDCYTTIPSTVAWALEKYCDEKITNSIYPPGAGDIVSTIPVFTSLARLRFFLDNYLEENERDNDILILLALVLLVSAFQRVAAAFVLHSIHTQWVNVRKEAIADLFSVVAEDAVASARNMVKGFHIAAIGELKKFGIKAVVWNPHKLAELDQQAATTLIASN